MKSQKNEFPNPVLAAGRDDYIAACQFGTVFDPEKIVVTSDDIIIPISYSLVCNGLQQLIDDNKALAVIGIKSSSSSYSRLFIFPKEETAMELHIPKFKVVKRIELTGSIIATAAMNDFKCEGEFNDLYFSSSTFEIRKGDVLAKEDTRIIYVDDTELEKPIASIFNINRTPSQEDDVMPDFSGDKIEINLKEELYNLYFNFKDFNNGSLRRYITSVIVYPVLVEAISKICEFYREDLDDGSDDKRWFRAIEGKAQKLGISFNTYQDSTTLLANKLLGDIALDALKSFKDTLDSEINNGETQMLGGVD
jgi:hypothetical protein